jgi:hypothetical protein
MKRIFYILVLAFSVGFTGSVRGQGVMIARNYLMRTYNGVNTSTYYLNRVHDSPNRVVAMQRIDTLKFITQEWIDYIDGITPYDENNDLKSNCLIYLNHIKKISNNELPEYYNFYYNTSRSQADVKKADKLSTPIFKTTLTLYQNYKELMLPYQEKYYITLPLDLKMNYVRKTSFADVLEYRDYISEMVFFSEKILYLYFEEEDKEFNEIWNDSLKSATKRMLGYVENIEPYKGYDGFRQATITYLKHLIRLSENELVELNELYYTDPRTDSIKARMKVIDPIIDSTRIALRGRWLRTQSTLTGKQGIFVEPYYPNHIWPDTPKVNFTERTTFTSAAEYDDYVVEIVFTLRSYLRYVMFGGLHCNVV